jgi:hypothetical protein
MCTWHERHGRQGFLVVDGGHQSVLRAGCMQRLRVSLLTLRARSSTAGCVPGCLPAALGTCRRCLAAGPSTCACCVAYAANSWCV